MMKGSWVLKKGSVPFTNSIETSLPCTTQSTLAALANTDNIFLQRREEQSQRMAGLPQGKYRGGRHESRSRREEW